jgi:hypothetical protein
MKTLYIIICVVSIFTIGALAHERDMANNCAKTGNASAWLNEIKCEVSL